MIIRNNSKIKLLILLLLFIIPKFSGYSQYCKETIRYSIEKEFKFFIELNMQKFNQKNELIEETICENGNYGYNASKDTLFVRTYFYKNLVFNDTTKTYTSENQMDWDLFSIRINKNDTVRVMKCFYSNRPLYDTIYIKENNLLKSIWVVESGRNSHTKHMDFIYNGNCLVEKLIYVNDIPQVKHTYYSIKKNKKSILVENSFVREKNDSLWHKVFVDTLIYETESISKLVKKITVAIDPFYQEYINYSYRKNFLCNVSEYEGVKLYSQILIRKVKNYKLKNVVKKAWKLYNEDRKQYSLYIKNR